MYCAPIATDGGHGKMMFDGIFRDFAHVHSSVVAWGLTAFSLDPPMLPRGVAAVSGSGCRAGIGCDMALETAFLGKFNSFEHGAALSSAATATAIPPIHTFTHFHDLRFLFYCVWPWWRGKKSTILYLSSCLKGGCGREGRRMNGPNLHRVWEGVTRIVSLVCTAGSRRREGR
jgi:hypothetical protein